MTWRLLSQEDGLGAIASTFAKPNSNTPLKIEVCEDFCFRHGWLHLADVQPFTPGSQSESELRWALAYGAYQVAFRSAAEVTQECGRLIEDDGNVQNRRPKGNDRIKPSLKGVAHAAARSGLIHPIIDAGYLSNLPLRRPTSMVSDTSAVIQGCLAFAARHFGQHLRIKVPAIVHMELLNSADNYFSIRRKRAVRGRGRALDERVRSQGGQRALIRLELSSNLELDRPRVGADPLRGIVTPSSDTEDANLQQSDIIRSFADRLIVESALRHREQMSPGHGLLVLTGDQGMARMCISEGLTPLFFRPLDLEDVFGQTLSGVVLNPFVSLRVERPPHCVPLTELLWELAVTFGSVRLSSGDLEYAFAAIGETLPWMPYHSTEDLLWGHFGSVQQPQEQESSEPHVTSTTETPDVHHPESKLPRVVDAVRTPRTPSKRHDTEDLNREMTAHSRTAMSARKADTRGSTDHRLGTSPPYSEGLPLAQAVSKSDETPPLVESMAGNARQSSAAASYRVSLKNLFALIQCLVTDRTVAQEKGMALVGVQLDRGYSDYKGFLVAGGLAETRSALLVPTEGCDALWSALIARDVDTAARLFRQVRSFDMFVHSLQTGATITESNGVDGVQARAFGSYATISEVVCAGLRVGSQVLGTPSHPNPSEFREMALREYGALCRRDEWVLTGEWLERLARVWGVHPIRARHLLEDCRRAGSLGRFTEGSTPPQKEKGRLMSILMVENAMPRVDEVSIYTGGFLLADRASVRLRLEQR